MHIKFVWKLEEIAAVSALLTCKLPTLHCLVFSIACPYFMNQRTNTLSAAGNYFIQ